MKNEQYSIWEILKMMYVILIMIYEMQIKFPIYQKSDLIKDETVAEPVFCKVGKNFL